MTATARPAPARPTAPRYRGLLTGRRGRAVGLGLATAALLAAVWASIAVGVNAIGLDDIVHAVGTPVTDGQRVIHHLRIPRTSTGLLAGMALGAAGTVMQGITRNPLAEPGLLGVNAGAALAVVVAMAGLGIVAPLGYVAFAFAGAAGAALLVYTLGSIGSGGPTPVKLTLAGAATTAFFGAVTTMITLQDVTLVDDFRFWAVGSLTRSDATSLSTVAPFLAVGLLLAVALTRSLNAQALGEDLARGLGSRTRLARATAAVVVVLLAGGATALAGPLAFVGLVVPHVARMITGPDYRWVMAWTVVMAPALLLASDVLGRIVAQPQQLQVGIVTGLAGAPFFLWLVRNRKLVGV